jgi:flagellar biosynthetic protein FliO
LIFRHAICTLNDHKRLYSSAELLLDIKTGALRFFVLFSDMTQSRKKIIVFCVTVVLGCGVLLVCSARSATEEKELKSSEIKSNSLFGNDPNFLTNKKKELGTRELFFKFMVSVLFIVALGAGGIYISKRFLPKIGNLSGKEIRIVETVHIGPRKAVHLLEIGGRRFLIGSTNENVTKLAELTSAFTEL